jgi:hypothetical protein
MALGSTEIKGTRPLCWGGNDFVQCPDCAKK